MDEETRAALAKLEAEILGLKATLLVTNSRTVALESLVTELAGTPEQIQDHLRRRTVEACYRTLAALSDNSPRLGTEVKQLIDRLYGPRTE